MSDSTTFRMLKCGKCGNEWDGRVQADCEDCAKNWGQPMAERRLISDEELEMIRGKIRIYDNRVAERDVNTLLSHIAAQSDEIKRLRAVIDEQHHVRVDETELHDLYETRQQALRDQLGPLEG